MGDLIRKIAEYNGLDVTLNLLQEECAELVQAISKRRRDPDKLIEKIVEETADVMLLIREIDYLEPLFDLNVERKIREKAQRTAERLGLREG